MIKRIHPSWAGICADGKRPAPFPGCRRSVAMGAEYVFAPGEHGPKLRGRRLSQPLRRREVQAADGRALRHTDTILGIETIIETIKRG